MDPVKSTSNPIQRCDGPNQDSDTDTVYLSHDLPLTDLPETTGESLTYSPGATPIDLEPPLSIKVQLKRRHSAMSLNDSLGPLTMAVDHSLKRSSIKLIKYQTCPQCSFRVRRSSKAKAARCNNCCQIFCQKCGQKDYALKIHNGMSCLSFRIWRLDENPTIDKFRFCEVGSNLTTDRECSHCQLILEPLTISGSEIQTQLNPHFRFSNPILKLSVFENDQPETRLITCDLVAENYILDLSKYIFSLVGSRSTLELRVLPYLGTLFRIGPSLTTQSQYLEPVSRYSCNFQVDLGPKPRKSGYLYLYFTLVEANGKTVAASDIFPLIPTKKLKALKGRQHRLILDSGLLTGEDYLRVRDYLSFEDHQALEYRLPCLDLYFTETDREFIKSVLLLTNSYLINCFFEELCRQGQMDNLTPLRILMERWSQTLKKEPENVALLHQKWRFVRENYTEVIKLRQELELNKPRLVDLI